MKQSRSDLIGLLSEACELEHGLACSYLYSAFTLKQSAYEQGLDSSHLQCIRKWAGQLYFIASQEMMHLAQVWNLLTAIGGTPYYFRPNYPVNHKYYPTRLPILLEPFGKSSLKRFIFYELPGHVDDVKYLEREFRIKKDKIEKAFTVGELYKQIAAGLQNIPSKELFIGDPEIQVGAGTVHFNELVKVTDLKSALEGIKTIVTEGEGNSNDQVDCHYGMFVSVNKDLDKLIKEAKKKGTVFEPARQTILNPVTSFYKEVSPASSNAITDVYTNEVAALFDNLYSIMLRILQFVFQMGSSEQHIKNQLAEVSIQIMTRVIKPLGESLTMLPAGKSYGKSAAGPAFGLYRHVSLPKNSEQAIILVSERLNEIISQGKILGQNKKAPPPLLEAITKLQDISTNILKGKPSEA
jgi:hypothetical protein